MPKDRVYRLPRIWSNQELKKVAPLFSGDVVNVSAWKDSDKEGKHYRDYFQAARSYTITNFKSEARGYQGLENEIFMDLEADLPDEMVARFDVVYNHTTVEHIYDFQKAISNICRMSRDVVIIVLPFLQQYHTDYGDYWRFSPLAIRRLFEDNDMTLVYQSFNSHPASSVYTFTIAAKNPAKWREHFNWTFSCIDPTGRGNEPYIGCHAIPNWGHRIKQGLRRLLGKSSS
jgi:SAM-dependent methyltransferase